MERQMRHFPPDQISPLFSISQILLDYKIRILKDRGRPFVEVPLGSGRKNEQEEQINLEFMVLAFK